MLATYFVLKAIDPLVAALSDSVVRSPFIIIANTHHWLSLSFKLWAASRLESRATESRLSAARAGFPATFIPWLRAQRLRLNRRNNNIGYNNNKNGTSNKVNSKEEPGKEKEKKEEEGDGEAAIKGGREKYKTSASKSSS